MANKRSTRREFIAHATVLGATGALAGCVAPSAAKPGMRRSLQDNDRIVCGFIGVGLRGMSILESILGMDGVDMVAIADTYDANRDRAVAACRKKHPEVRGYTVFEEMLETEKLDAVVIATPDHVHAPAVLYALDRGLDVYVEKPMTLTWEDAKAVRDHAAAKGAVVQVGTQLRSMSMYQRAREVVQAGELGPLVLVQVNRHHVIGRMDPKNTPADANEENVHWKSFLRDTKWYPYDPLRYFAWRHYLEYSNGYFGDIMLHHLDICHFITGCGMPMRVTAVGGVYYLDDGRTCPDTLSALAEYPEKFHFNYTTTAVNGHYGLVERYMFAEGVIEVRDMGAMSIFRGDAEEKVPSKGILNEPHLQDFFDCIRSRKKTIAPPEAGMMGATCAHMALTSALTGATATWRYDTETVEM